MDESSTDLFHRHTLELVRRVSSSVPIDARYSPSPELLGALGGHVHKKKTTGDWNGGLSGPVARSVGIRQSQILGHVAKSS